MGEKNLVTRRGFLMRVLLGSAVMEASFRLISVPVNMYSYRPDLTHKLEKFTRALFPSDDAFRKDGRLIPLKERIAYALMLLHLSFEIEERKNPKTIDEIVDSQSGECYEFCKLAVSVFALLDEWYGLGVQVRFIPGFLNIYEKQVYKYPTLHAWLRFKIGKREVDVDAVRIGYLLDMEATHSQRHMLAVDKALRKKVGIDDAKLMRHYLRAIDLSEKKLYIAATRPDAAYNSVDVAREENALAPLAASDANAVFWGMIRKVPYVILGTCAYEYYARIDGNMLPEKVAEKLENVKPNFCKGLEEWLDSDETRRQFDKGIVGAALGGIFLNMLTAIRPLFFTRVIYYIPPPAVVTPKGLNAHKRDIIEQRFSECIPIFLIPAGGTVILTVLKRYPEDALRFAKAFMATWYTQK